MMLTLLLIGDVDAVVDVDVNVDVDVDVDVDVYVDIDIGVDINVGVPGQVAEKEHCGDLSDPHHHVLSQRAADVQVREKKTVSDIIIKHQKVPEATIRHQRVPLKLKSSPDVLSQRTVDVQAG